MSILLNTKPSPNVVIAKAVLNAAKQLGLSDTELGAVLGVDRTAISKLRAKPSIKPDSKKGELALLLVRVARALFALVGGDGDWIIHFMRTSNKVTGGIPAEQVQNIAGLMTVLQFLDAIRSKV